MLKYVDTKEVFSEIPDEITLAISISGCPIHCKNCHSQYLWEDIGDELTEGVLEDLIKKHNGITCVCFMGGDNDVYSINYLAKTIRDKFPGLLVAWYSGQDLISSLIDLSNFDFIKIGRYDEESGPLNNSNTNQIFYKIEGNNLIDITYKFNNKNRKI